MLFNRKYAPTEQSRDKMQRFIADLLPEYLQFTPDYAALQRYEHQFLFVYDEMQRGHRGSEYLSDAQFKAIAFTEDKYSVWKRDAGKYSYPIAFDMKTPDDPKWMHRRNAPSASVRGEIYKIPTPMFLELDFYRMNTVEFQRRRVNLMVPSEESVWVTKYMYDDNPKNDKIEYAINRRQRIDKVRAWMYIGDDWFWEHLDGGYRFSPVQIFEPNMKWLDKYCQFTPPEYRNK